MSGSVLFTRIFANVAHCCSDRQADNPVQCETSVKSLKREQREVGKKVHDS